MIIWRWHGKPAKKNLLGYVMQNTILDNKLLRFISCSSLLVYSASCRILPAVEILVDSLVFDFHELPKLWILKNLVKVLKIYISSWQPVSFLDGTLTPKTDRFRGEGSNPLVRLIRGRIGSASRSDPMVSCENEAPLNRAPSALFYR